MGSISVHLEAFPECWNDALSSFNWVKYESNFSLTLWQGKRMWNFVG